MPAFAPLLATSLRALASHTLLVVCALQSTALPGHAATPAQADDGASAIRSAPAMTVVREVIIMTHPAAGTASADELVFEAPLADFRLSSPFGPRRHPIRGRAHSHSGADLAVPRGTPVHAVADGTVVALRTLRTGYGRHVVVDHGNGYSSWYAHLDRIDGTLHVGDAITRGSVVGTAGSTGSATGPHLHLEIRLHGVPMEPMALLQQAPTAPAPIIGIAPAWRANAAPP